MASQYNQNLRFHDHSPDSKVWLQKKFIRSGENKLAPRGSGPWTVLEKLSNGANFQIRNNKSRKLKVLHHDRLKVVRENLLVDEGVYIQSPLHREETKDDDESGSVASSGDESNYTPTESDTDSGADADEGSRYPARECRRVAIPGAIPWDTIRL